MIDFLIDLFSPRRRNRYAPSPEAVLNALRGFVTATIKATAPKAIDLSDQSEAGRDRRARSAGALAGLEVVKMEIDMMLKALERGEFY